jgi:hypothetical protein
VLHSLYIVDQSGLAEAFRPNGSKGSDQSSDVFHTNCSISTFSDYNNAF